MDELLTVAEVAALLKVNKNKVHDLINAGLLPCLVLGRRKVRRASLERFLQVYEGCDITDPWNIKAAERGTNETNAADNLPGMGGIDFEPTR